MGIYDELVENRIAVINGKSYVLMWPKNDHGTWDGPLENLPSHLELWKKHIRNYNVCITAGSAMGMYPAVLADMFKRVYTFEPTSLSFHCAVNNLQSDNVFKLNAALGESCGMCSVKNNSQDNMGMNTVLIEDDSKVPMLTIDSLNLDACDAIILDVEGFESRILFGAEMTIAKFKPMISCENGNDIIRDFLSNYGYREVGKSYADTVYSV